jgi:recombination protein RecA
MTASYSHSRKINLSELGKLAKLLKERKLGGTHPSGAVRHYLDTGYPPLNEIVSGDPFKGLPSGQLVMIGGPSASGKTMIATQLMISAQQLGGYAAFFDYETQYHADLAKKQGLIMDDDEKFQFYKPDTFEQGVTQAIQLGKLIRDNDIIPQDAPIVMVFDSLKTMTPQSVYDNLFAKGGNVEKGEKMSMHDKLALASTADVWFPVIQREFDKFGITGIFLNQVRKKTNPANPSIVTYTYPGGDQAYYICSTVLLLTATSEVEGSGDSKRLLGRNIKCLTDKSRNSAPMQSCRWNFVINEADKSGNFDVIGSYAEHLRKIGAIESKGPRVVWNGGSPFLSQVIEELREAPDGLEQLKTIHREFNGRA